MRLEAQRPWVTKDPRFSVLLPFWRRYHERPVCVFVYRHPLEVALSLATRNSFPSVFSLSLWEQIVRRSLVEAIDLPRVWVPFQSLHHEPMAAATKLHRDLLARGVTGLCPPSPSEVRSFVDPSLYRSRAKDPGGQLSPSQQALWELLEQEPDQLDAAEVGEPEPAPWREPYARLIHERQQISAGLAVLSGKHPEQNHAATSYRSLELDIEALDTRLRGLRRERRASDERVAALLAELEVARRGASTLRAELVTRDRDARELARRLHRADAELERFARLVDRVFSTRRWRIGDRLVSFARRLALRPMIPIGVIEELEDLRSSEARREGAAE